MGVSRRRSAALLAIDLAVAAGVVAACSGGGKPAPTVVPVVTTTTFTTLVDHSSDSLASISGITTVPPVAITPGNASITGTALDDTGAPVPGATVGLERVVGGALAQTTVVAGATGGWAAQGIQGGIYRVRAWRPPDLAETAPQIVFLPATGTQSLNLTLNHFSGISVQASVAPNPPIIGEPANIAIEVTGSVVGTDGLVRSQGEPNLPVAIFGQGQWAISGPTTSTTSASGFALWQGTCTQLGPQDLSVLVNTTQAFALNLPPCSPVPTTTTSTSTSTTLRGGSTTTTQPDKHKATTTVP
ncbi:MAG TPA: carboxypeptidase-like regulatory domain-containing protein [Acidimicrobiales bacterium]